MYFPQMNIGVCHKNKTLLPKKINETRFLNSDWNGGVEHQKTFNQRKHTNESSLIYFVCGHFLKDSETNQILKTFLKTF